MDSSVFGESNLLIAVEVVTAVAVVIGIAFGLIQLRQVTQSRCDYAAVGIVGTVQTQEVRMAVRLIFNLPENADPGSMPEKKFRSSGLSSPVTVGKVDSVQVATTIPRPARAKL